LKARQHRQSADRQAAEALEANEALV